MNDRDKNSSYTVQLKEPMEYAGQKSSKKSDPSYTVKILVPDSGTGFSQLVPANTNRSATLIENPTNCKQNVYFQYGLTAMKHTHDFSSLISEFKGYRFSSFFSDRLIKTRLMYLYSQFRSTI